MLKAIVTVAAAAAVPIGRSTRNQKSYSSLVVFGDSFSDNGDGAYRISNRTWPLVPPYYQGHFSNGPVWPQYVAANLSLPLLDYAVGGATTSNALIQGFTGPASTIPVPSVADQVAAFLAGLSPQNTSLSSSSAVDQDEDGNLHNPLFIIWGGANDVLFNPSISAAQSHAALTSAVAALRAAYPQGSGATVLTVASPDLAKLPYGFYVEPDAVGGKRALTAFTDLLAALLVDGAKGKGSLVDGNVDLRGLFEEFEYYAQPEVYGFDPLGKYGSCLVGVYGEGNTSGSIQQCGDVDGRVYWDEYHPTTLTHSWIAKEISYALS
ncbi:unnamed protein product [Discula destructiva]